MDRNQLIKNLSVPTGVVDAVIDTDTYNEVDDQFALAYLIKSTEKINLKAIYATPFFNNNSSSPSDGMHKSYDEIFKIFPETKTVITLGFRVLRGIYKGVEEGTTFYQYTTMGVENLEETVMPLTLINVANLFHLLGVFGLRLSAN